MTLLPPTKFPKLLETNTADTLDTETNMVSLTDLGFSVARRLTFENANTDLENANMKVEGFRIHQAHTISCSRQTHSREISPHHEPERHHKISCQEWCRHAGGQRPEFRPILDHVTQETFDRERLHYMQ